MIFAPPKAPFPPRAIFHATWGPVHASVTRAARSSMRPDAISPAGSQSTRRFQQPPCVPKVHRWGFGSYVAETRRPFSGYRDNQSATLSSARKSCFARCAVSRAVAWLGANGVWMIRPFES